MAYRECAKAQLAHTYAAQALTGGIIVDLSLWKASRYSQTTKRQQLDRKMTEGSEFCCDSAAYKDKLNRYI
jgi:hypothetical protein